jgi:hypothetical protein
MKGNIAIIAIVVAAVLLGGAYYVATSKEAPLVVVPTNGTPSAATTTPQGEPMLASVTLRTKLNEGASGNGITLIPLEVVEDSRCPMEVQCVWAGTVKVRATLRSPSGEGVEVFELGKTITTETMAITLVEVLPQKRVTNVVPQEYRLVFEVKKRADL